MDIYATREELKSRQKNIFDLKLNVAYYARVSTDKEEQKTSIEHQWTFFEQLISDVKNWTLVDGYIDEGISGITVTHREEFQRMLQDAKAGKIDLIITKEITRFARNVLDSIRYTRELLDCGTAVWFRNDNINTLDEDSELRLSICPVLHRKKAENFQVVCVSVMQDPYRTVWFLVIHIYWMGQAKRKTVFESRRGKNGTAYF